MKNLIRQWIQQTALFLGAAVSVPAIAVEINILNETNLDVGVKVAGAVTPLPGAASQWISGADHVTVTKPGGDTLEYRFDEMRSGSTGDSCAFNVIAWGYRVKIFEKTSSTGAERMLGEICAARSSAFKDIQARLRFYLDENSDYGLVFENRGALSQVDGRVASISASLPVLGKSAGFASGLLASGDFVLENRGQCLVNGDNGRALVPERFSWGGAGLCGLGAAAVHENSQAVFTLRKVDAERYALLSRMWNHEYVNGFAVGQVFTGQSCLQANADGTIERTHAGTFNACHVLSDATFQSRPELLWKIKRIGGGTFITSSAYGGIEKCLMFPNKGQDLQPNLWNWGLGGEVCGLPRGQFDSKGQAGWKLVRLD